MPALPAAKRQTLLPFLQQAIDEFGIAAPARQAAFLAQLAHESGQFRFMEEIWGPTAAQNRYEPATDLATRLGNTQAGDGKLFKGRGPIQLTGRANYQRFGGLLNVDLLGDPQRAATPEVAFRIAALFWQRKGLNELADQVSPEAFREITRRINGGFNGLPDREKFYATARQVLSVTGPVLADAAPGSGRRGLEIVQELDRGFEAIVALAVVEEAAPAKRATKKRAAKKPVKKAAAKKPAAKKPAAKRAPVKKGGSKKPLPRKGASKRPGLKDGMASKRIVRRTAKKR